MQVKHERRKQCVYVYNIIQINYGETGLSPGRASDRVIAFVVNQLTLGPKVWVVHKKLKLMAGIVCAYSACVYAWWSYMVSNNYIKHILRMLWLFTWRTDEHMFWPYAYVLEVMNISPNAWAWMITSRGSVGCSPLLSSLHFIYSWEPQPTVTQIIQL